MKRWVILLFAALLIGFIGIATRQNYLEATGFVIALLAIALFIWSIVQFSFQVRPPTTRRRFRRVHMPSIRRRRPVQGSYTDELHAAIFQDQTAE